MKELAEDLKIANDNLYSANQMLYKETERLNNIINELEKYYEEELKNLNYSEDKIYVQGIHDTIISHKYKLQELKGSNNNEQ